MESLKSKKFDPLSIQAMMAIKGGVITRGETSAVFYEIKEERGKRYRRAYKKSYSADDIDGTKECYTDLEYCYGDWEDYPYE